MGGRISDLDYRATPMYRRGLAQLAAWHEYCREKRLGIPEMRIKLEQKTGHTLGGYINNDGIPAKIRF